MEPPRKHKCSAMSVNTSKEEGEIKDGNSKRRRTESGDSTGKDPMDVLTSCAAQNSFQANGCSHGSASSRLPKICKAIGWKEPSFDFEEQGPPHNRIFKCKVTVHLDGLANTIVECFGDPKHRKKAARENAAQGALWCLQQWCPQRSGYVK